MASVCSGVGCRSPAKLKCPTCLKLGLSPAPFCSQDCFKKNWIYHKLLHNQPATTTGPPLREEFAGYVFTGSLRPYEVSAYRPIPDHIQRPDYWQTGVPASEERNRGNNQIHIHTPEEIEKMRTVCRISREVLEAAAAAVKPGVTTDEIDRIVHEACIERDSYPSPLNYREFPKSCCTSINEVICHGIPDSRELQEGDICNIDVSVFHDGFHGDVNATYAVGEVDEASKLLVRVTRECLDLAIAMVKPGVLYRDVGSVIQRHANAHGLSVVKTYCGHGIGELFHTAPSIPHYGKNKAVGVMRPGHIFTIEPMINAGVWQDQLWPDEWTAVTRDGKRSAQFEETMLVTETGVEILTAKRT